MKIYTKTGDNGKTSLIYGKRVSKANLRIEAYGTVDELNAQLGLLNDQPINKNRNEFIKNIQDCLFVVGSNLASELPNSKLPFIDDADIELLENEIDRMTNELEPLKNFILPGGHISVSICHIARTVCRRAERVVVGLGEIEKIDEKIIQYLNRLSDYLFVLSRKMAKELEIKEIVWNTKK